MRAHTPNYVDMVIMKTFIRAILGSNYCRVVEYPSRGFSRVSSGSEQNLGNSRSVHRLRQGECALLHMQRFVWFCRGVRGRGIQNARLQRMPGHTVSYESLWQEHYFHVPALGVNLYEKFSWKSAPARPRWIIVLMSDDVRRTKRGWDINQYIYFYGWGINMFNNSC